MSPFAPAHATWSTRATASKGTPHLRSASQRNDMRDAQNSGLFAIVENLGEQETRHLRGRPDALAYSALAPLTLVGPVALRVQAAVKVVPGVVALVAAGDDEPS